MQEKLGEVIITIEFHTTVYTLTHMYVITSFGLACLPSMGLRGAKRLTSTSCNLLVISLSFRHTCNCERTIIHYSVIITYPPYIVGYNCGMQQIIH